MELQGMMLSEVSRKERDKKNDLSYMWNTKLCGITRDNKKPNAR